MARDIKRRFAGAKPEIERSAVRFADYRFRMPLTKLFSAAAMRAADRSRITTIDYTHDQPGQFGKRKKQDDLVILDVLAGDVMH